MTRVLDVSGLRAGYGKITVLWDVDLHANEGELVTIIGANGAGKTTLLRAVSGLVPVRAGTVTAFGSLRLDGLSPAKIVRAGVGHVPEGRQLFELMTVRENLDSGAEHLSHARAGANRNREFVYELFPRLAERRDQRALTLSGGEQQMLAIGRALMTNPRLLILDEATEGLAPVIRQDIWAAIRQLKTEGQSILVVDKTLADLLVVADRCAVLENGRTVWTGTAAELGPAVQDRYLGI